MPDIQELEPVFNQIARYFALLAEPSRLKVIHAICHVELTVNDVMMATGLSQSAASRHLSSLHTAGVASRRKDGAQAFYVICDHTLTDICRTASVSVVAGDSNGEVKLAPRKRPVALPFESSAERHAPPATTSQKPKLPTNRITRTKKSA